MPELLNKNQKTTSSKGGLVFGLLNLGSLVLGLIAWILPIVNLTRDKKQENKNWFALSIISMLLAAYLEGCF
ncbi:hypothetical protein [Bacillus solitudinis]|uniref:hypothetical protein n=1 Tax=Bacillus solitudinis TaxID=2014074 RepID=UPI000C24F98C|nr:hypothetical protein [Bacillus solitudinis]